MIKTPARQHRTPDPTAGAALLLMVVLLTTAVGTGLDRTSPRPGAHGGASVSLNQNHPLIEETNLPGCGLLAPPSESLASVGSRSGADVLVDLAHLAGDAFELERRRHDLPPPARA